MLTTKPKRTCCVCSKNLIGRKDKVYCSDRCKYIHHKKAKKQTFEIQLEENSRLIRNNIVLEGILGLNTSRMRLHHSLLFQHGFDVFVFKSTKTINGNRFFNIGKYLFRLLSNNIVEVIRVEKIRVKIDEFFNRWERSFGVIEDFYEKTRMNIKGYLIERLEFF